MFCFGDARENANLYAELFRCGLSCFPISWGLRLAEWNVLVVGKESYYPLGKISSHKFNAYEYDIVYNFFLMKSKFLLGGRDWAATLPKCDMKKQCRPNAKSGVLYGTRLEMFLLSWLKISSGGSPNSLCSKFLIGYQNLSVTQLKNSYMFVSHFLDITINMIS
jgi:hypothetical protein